MKTILHFIDSLGLGGAETLMANYIPELTNYKHILVICSGVNDYQEETKGIKLYSLNQRISRRTFFNISKKLREIITTENIDIVHSHSYWTNLVARVATPKQKMVINHYHFADYDTRINTFKVRFQLLLDRLTKHPSLCRIGVSDYVHGILNKKFRRSYNICLPNFVNAPLSQLEAKEYMAKTPMKIIAVGSIKLEKNYELLIDVFEKLNNYPITMDIYGEGYLREQYISQLKQKNLNTLRFVGATKTDKTLLLQYNLYCSSSTSETFGLALLEGVSAGLPILASDIKAFKEVSPAGTIFFKDNDKSDLLDKIIKIYNTGIRPSKKEYLQTLDNFSKERFMEKLNNIYRSFYLSKK